jgi:HEAT repeat protein
VDEEGSVAGPDGARTPDLDRLWALACLWEVGDNRVVVPIARERLVALGAPALDRAFERIGTKDGLEGRAVEATIRAFPREAVIPRLLERTRDPEAMIRRGAVRVVSALALPEAYDRLVELLDDPALRAGALDALRALRRAPPSVPAFLASAKESEGVMAAACLGASGDAAAVEALVGALSPSYPFPVRIAAEQQLAALGEVARGRLEIAVRDFGAPPAQRRSALRVLGRARLVEARETILGALRDPDEWIRFSAAQAARDLAASLDPADAAALDRAVAEVAAGNERIRRAR